MSQIPSTGGSSSNPNVTTKTQTDLADVDINQFLTLMITELQNQDPLNPMSNADFLQQISTIRQIGSTNQLTTSLSAVTLGQNLGIASSLIGKKVTALGDDGKNVEGIVTSAAISVDAKDETKRTVEVNVNGTKVDISKIREIVGAT